MTDSMTPKALADLRALAEAATPGPWTAFESAAVWELYADRDEVKHGLIGLTRALAAPTHPEEEG